MTSRSVPSPQAPEQPELGVRLPYLAGGIAVVAALAIIAFVYAYGTLAGDLVRSLDSRIGEVIVVEAKALAKAGDSDAALERYREALAARFDDPQQRYWALRGYGELLLQHGQAAEATETLIECLKTNPEDGIAMGLLARSYRAEGKFTEMADISTRWVNAAAQEGKAPNVAVANRHLGEALEHLGRTDDALAAYLAGARIAPQSDCAYHAAVLLNAEGKRAEALALLEAYLPKASGWRSESAAKLRDTLRTAPLDR